jgi:demethylmenaquinone methyltransferase/2-methoxy-6-polyprenyl-1,4-benzoquinol methylase
LRHLGRVLKPGGLLLIADEVRPRTVWARLLHTLIRIPLVALTYLITQQTTRAIVNLPEKIERAGLSIESERRGALGSFVEIVARKLAVEAS